MRFDPEVLDALLGKAGGLFDTSLAAAKDGRFDRALDDHDAAMKIIEACRGEQ